LAYIARFYPKWQIIQYSLGNANPRKKKKTDIRSSWFPFQDWASQAATQIATQLCGFVTIVAGTFLLHKTRDMGNPPPPDQVCLEEARECAPRSTNSSS